MMSKRSNIVKSVIKAFDVLEVLDKKQELGISELSEYLDLDKSTIHRLVTTLKEKGYVVQNPSNLKYSNGIKLFEMGNNVVERLGLRRQAQPFMEKLARMTGETVNLAIMDGKHIIYIDKIETPATIKVDLNIGKKLPIYCTGLGKAMLAFKEEEELEQLLKDETFIKHTSKTVENMEGLKKQLKEIKSKGYALDDEEFVEGLKCVAAPIKNYTGEVVAALSVAVPKYRYEEGNKQIDYIDLVKSCAEGISKELGYKN